MKKVLKLAALFLTLALSATAQNALTVGDFTMSRNGGSIAVGLTLAETGVYTSYQFKVETPEGMAYVVDGDDDVDCTLGGSHAKSHAATAHWNSSERLLAVGVASMSSALFTGQNLTISIPLAATTADIGSTFNFTVTGITFIKQTGEKVPLDDVTFTVTIGDSRVVLDENAATAPVDAEGVDVRVKRTISAGRWSTICLPFAMNEAQVKTAFGEEVQLGDFVDYDTEEDGDAIIAIQVNFESASAIEANHPYIIKVSDTVEEFLVDNVDIEVEEEPSVEYDNGLTGKKRVVFAWFTGTYVPMEVPENTLFLNSNKFWYSRGASLMKGYRAYFDLTDMLSSVDESRIILSVPSEATGISTPLTNGERENDEIYNLSGQRVKTAGKGVYIMNGKKVVKK